MSTHEVLQTEAPEVHTVDKSDGASTENSPNLIEEWLKASLEPLHA